MKRAKIPYWLIIKRYWVRLAAICVTWFLYDFISYPVRYFSFLSSFVSLSDTAPDSLVSTVRRLQTREHSRVALGEASC
jgi:hypothetical protein